MEFHHYLLLYLLVSRLIGQLFQHSRSSVHFERLGQFEMLALGLIAPFFALAVLAVLASSGLVGICRRQKEQPC